jgi:hypothetical protein
MTTLNIKTHKFGREYSKPHFFIQNKGNNSGKPLKNEIPNCFVFLSESEEEKEFYYSLLFALWSSKAFYIFLRGSVIPFIVLHELKNCIRESEVKVNANFQDFQKSISTFRQLEQAEINYKQNLRLIQEAKRLIFRKYIKK